MAGIETVSIPIRYVVVSATQPTSAFVGQLWYDETTGVSYQWDGATWNAFTPDVDYLNKLVMQNALGILKLEAVSTASTQDYDTIFLDTFSDTTGYDNTIDTGNTTATYDSTNKVYANYTVTSANDAPTTYSTTGADTNKAGMQILTTKASTLTNVKKHASSTATKCYLQDSSFNTLATADFSGQNATFNYALSNATTYNIVTDSAGASRTAVYVASGASYPQVKTNLNYTSSSYAGSNIGTQWRELIEISTVAYGTPANSLIQTNSITLPSNITAYQVYSEKTTAGTGTVTFDIKIGSEAYQTGKALNTKYANTDAGTTALLKLNLNGTGAGNSANASNYVLMVWV